MFKTNTTTNNTTATTFANLHRAAAEMNAAAAAAAVTPADYGYMPHTAISPAFAAAAAAATAAGDSHAAAALTAAAAIYKRMAVAAMGAAYLATTHSTAAAYVDIARGFVYVGDIADFVNATGGISCTSASRDRFNRTESRLTCKESAARRWGKTVAVYPVNIPAAAAKFPAMDAGKQREHAAAIALGDFTHIPDDRAYYLDSDIHSLHFGGVSCKSGSGACFAPASALWAAAIHRHSAAAAAMLTAACVIPVRHAAAMRHLHFPAISAADLYAVQQSAMLTAAASGLLYRETQHGVRISAGDAVIDISFND